MEPNSSPKTPPEFQNDPGLAERRWLRRRGWILALLGIPAGFLIGAEFWRFVLLDPAVAPRELADWLTPKGAAIGLGLASIPLLWRLGLWLEQRIPSRWRQWPMAPLLALLVVLCAEGSFRVPLCQTVFWQAVRVRAGAKGHLTREVSLLRLDAANLGSAPLPGIVLLGSSQLVYGIDVPALAAQTGRPVHRRAVAGLFPTEIVASQGWSDFHPDNRLAMMLSGFDLGARRDLVPDAIRPLATPAGMRDLMAAAEFPFRIRHWRSLVDLNFAAVCDLWRSRDHARFLLEHPFQVAEPTVASADQEALVAQKAAYQHLGSSREMVALCRRALEIFFEEMSGRCLEIVVFEGRVNPTYPSEDLETLHAETRAFLLRQQQKGFIRFVPIEEQALDLPVSLWRDMTHVNAEGRRKYTEMFARILAEPPQRRE